MRAAAEAFNTSTTHVSFAGKAFLSKEVVRLVTETGMFVDTCTMGEMKIALAGVPGRRLVLHGNNKSDEEIALAIEQGFAKIVIDEPERAGARRCRSPASSASAPASCCASPSGVHAGGHEYISTAHEDQKFGVLAAGRPGPTPPSSTC